MSVARVRSSAAIFAALLLLLLLRRWCLARLGRSRARRLYRPSFLTGLLGPLDGARIGSAFSAEFLAGLLNRARLELPLLLDRPRLFDGPRLRDLPRLLRDMGLLGGPRLELRGLFEPPGLLRGRRLLNGP